MPEQFLTPFVTPDQKRSFPKAVTEAFFRSSKLRAKVKQLRRALSVKKKSVDLSCYSPIISKSGDCHGSYYLQASTLALTQSTSGQRESSAETVNRLESAMKSLSTTDLTVTFDKVAVDADIYTQKYNKLQGINLRKQCHSFQHDSTATCVVELFPDENICEDISSKQTSNVKEILAEPALSKPAVRPSATLKRDLYSDVTKFKHLDSHAIQVARHHYTDSSKLVRDLTENCKTELDKARVLFKWMIAMEQKNASKKPQGGPNVIGHGGVQCQILFNNLCRQAGMHSEIIVGYSKGAGHKPGMPLDHKSHRNSWNAVAVDGTWRFVNCTWAARHMTGSEKSSSRLLHKYDEFYFLTDPEEHIYQHFPDDPKWQLLDKTLSFEEFTNLPSVKSPYFKHGLQFSYVTPSLLKTENNSVEINLDALEHLKFESRLEMCESPLEQVTNHVLQRRVGSQIILTVVPPQPGSYYLSVYAGDSCTSDVLECVFCLRILHAPVCVYAESPKSITYPPVSTLGSTSLMSTLGVSTNSHHDPLVNMVNNTIRIDFNVRDDIKFTHTLQFYDSDSDSLLDIDRYAFPTIRTHSELSYSVACPRKGSYIFSLYGATRDSNTYDCLFQYLLVCSSDNLSYLSFPKSYNSWRDSSLLSPLHGELVQDTEYTFGVSVKKALKVFVVIGLEKYPLQKVEDSEWFGKVLTGDASPIATVIAEYMSETGNPFFTRLLEYDIL
ncbi:kyphoscoliosis peptidase-like [Liolophura sinensis]|uniref:kyphoscoliosis peptidase-like n=1 Tax=Liolophura sinensis TaxID=3198878 RepID=UPI003157FD7C